MNTTHFHQNHCALVLGSGVNALGMVRGFHQAGIKVIVSSHQKSIAGFSRYCEFKLSPRPFEQSAKSVKFLIELSREKKDRLVIFPADDSWLELLLNNWSLLKDFFIPSMDFNSAKIGFNKKKLYEISEELKIPVPKYSFFETLRYDDISNRKIFPCIIKIPLPIDHLRDLGINKKVFILNTQKDLEHIIKEFNEKQIENNPVVVQEIIEGETNNLYTLTCYSNQKGKIIAYTVGYKIHQWPPQAGTITSGKVLSSYDPRILKYSQKLLSKLKFRGISNIEFKYDKSKNEFYLMEINCRSGKWNTNALFSGINLMKLAFEDSIERSSKKTITPIIGKSSFIWIHELGELFFLLTKIKSPRSFIKSIRELKGDKKIAVFNLFDPLPFFCEIFFMIFRSIKLLIRKVLYKL